MTGSDHSCAAVVLCGGAGTRMGSALTHKVCFPIAGVPAVVRLVEALHAGGVGRIVMIVGAKADQVVSTVGQAYPDVMFVYQHEQLGTGHATRLGIDALQNMGQTGPILVTMGDKFVEPAVISELREQMVRRNADLIFTTTDKRIGGSYGRVIQGDDDRILGVVETRDIARARLLSEWHKLAEAGKSVSGGDLLKIGLKHIDAEVKLRRALGGLATLLDAKVVSAKQLASALAEQRAVVAVGGEQLSPDQLERRCATVNFGVYLAKSAAWYYAMPLIDNSNAQNEYYLPQAIGLLAAAHDASGARSYRVAEMVLPDPASVMGFNSPDELLAIEVEYRRRQAVKVTPRVRKLDPKRFRAASAWLDLFEKQPASVTRLFKQTYGQDEALWAERRRDYLKVLKLFARRYGGDTVCCIARAPGRVNLLGRHIDHRGGHVNVMAINREVLLVASPRDDDRVRLVNTDGKQFPASEFRIGDLMQSMAWDDWLTYVNSAQVQQIVTRSQGDWTNYVKAAVLRLQQGYRDVMVRGMDTAMSGSIPQAAGLSSSSAVVVATAEAAVAINHFDVTPAQFVDVCGEGEWFVGTRGGSADHAAIRFGRRGSVAHVGFFPFAVERTVQLPDDAMVVMANSLIKADKSSGVRDRFNQRIACYELSFLMLKHRFPQHAHLLEHLRDINPERLNCSMRDIYRMLLHVPQRMTRREIVAELGSQHAAMLDRIFSSHTEPASYDLRPVLAFGIGEARRSGHCVDSLESGDLAAFGNLMNVSHNGDRVVTHDDDLTASPYDWSTPDGEVAGLIDDLDSEDPDRVARAQLHRLAGGYACSTPQIDLMVDVARRTPGVYGAQLAGAGLGGCMMALVRRDAVTRVCRALTKAYYRPAKRQPAIIVCSPVQGSGLIVL